jgi:arginine deiminase
MTEKNRALKKLNTTIFLSSFDKILIMNEFLHSCKLKVYGYNKLNDEYWGENNNFYFTISLKNNENKTCVKINSLFLYKFLIFIKIILIL